MTEPRKDSTPNLRESEESESIPEDIAVEIRKLAHELSNALEVIVQTSYLLGTTEMKEPARDWLRIMDGGIQKAMDISIALRSYVKSRTEGE